MAELAPELALTGLQEQPGLCTDGPPLAFSVVKRRADPLLRHAHVIALWLMLAFIVPTSSTAAVITFAAPTVAATMECQGLPAPRFVPLERYEESGVRVISNELFGNRFMCDPTRAFGSFGQWQPLVLDPLQTSYGPLVYWWNDSAFLDVTSLSGQPIRGIDLTIVEKNSRVDWCSEIIQAPQGSISLCDGFSGHVAFADYGFADGLTSFRLGWGPSGRPLFGDPYVLLNAIEVPEPGSVALLGLVSIGVAWRRRRIGGEPQTKG